MLTLDIFRDQMFEAVELKGIIDDLEFSPGQVTSLDLFDDEPIRTTEVAITREGDGLVLVPTSERGAPFPQMTRNLRNAKLFSTKRVGLEDRIKSSELLNVISDGMPETMQLQRAAEETTKRFGKMRRNLELTREFYFLNALQGVWKDADGSTIYDFYDEFGLVAPSAVSIDLTVATNLNLREWIFNNIALPMTVALKNRATPGWEIHALCGDGFWVKLTTHPRVEKTYEGYAAAAELRNEVAVAGTFPYGGVVWHHYRGTDDNSTVDIATNQAKFFPKGATDVFKRFLSPGENIEHLGQLGEEWYPIVQPDPETNKNRWVDLELAQYPLPICLAPQVLLKAQHT